MRLLAYEGGLGATVVRLALLVFVMRGGRAVGLTEGFGAGDEVFNIGEMGADGDDDTSVAILPHESERRSVMRGELRFEFYGPAFFSLTHTHKLNSNSSTAVGVDGPMESRM